ncbi:MAG: hypothetical protein EOO57_18605, partial [Hymenobacter sp.]
MKLNYRYTLAYAVISFFVLSLGFVIVYAALSRSFTQATIGRLEHLNEVAANRLLSSRDSARLDPRPNVRIRLMPDTLRRPRTVLVRQEWDSALQARVVVVRLTTYPLLGERRYAITSRASVIEPNGVYLTGLVLVFAWTFVFLLALVVILS